MSLYEYWIGKGIDLKGVWDAYEQGAGYIDKFKSTRLHLIQVTFENPPTQYPLFEFEAVFKTMKAHFHEVKRLSLTVDEYTTAGPLYFYEVSRGSSIWSFLGGLRHLLLFGTTLSDESVKTLKLDNQLKELEIFEKKVGVLKQHFGQAVYPEDFQRFMQARKPEELREALSKMISRGIKKVEISKEPFQGDIEETRKKLVDIKKEIYIKEALMSDLVRAHINLFGAWAGEWTAEDAYAQKPGTEIIGDLIGLVLERKFTELTVAQITRFKELSPPELYVAVAPDEPKLVDRLLRPLKSAKRLYCFEEYLATIALCGLVGESLAMLVYRMRKVELGGKPISKEQEKLLLGSEFDKLGQERRVDILKCFGFISDEQERFFSELRATRRRYLHFWDIESSSIQQDAKQCFLNAMRLFKQVSELGLGPDGTFVMSPSLLAYIKSCEHG